MLQEQLLAELERIQLELDQLRGRPGSSYSRLDALKLYRTVFVLLFGEYTKEIKKNRVSPGVIYVECLFLEQIFVYYPVRVYCTSPFCL